ncbi:MAG TPA: oligosaccharide flippase family protein [Methylomirabilota bacterium]|nr:oligosaccharide flippase family protein [Methylomirabilota bacterium]
MTTVARNILANVAGSTLGMLAFLAVVPVYLRLLGPEAYGLVGLFATVMLAATALDLGLGATLNREVARTTAQAGAADGFANVAATLQAACWVVGIAAGAVFMVVTPAVAPHWLSFSALSPADVRGALALMGGALPALVARGFYLAGLNGLQRQGVANLVQLGGTLTRAAVTVAALRLAGPTPVVFFTTQLVVFYVEVAVLAAALHRCLPAVARHGRIHPATVRPLLRFSAGVAGTMLLGLTLMAMDQVVLSAILPLAQFGYYTLAVAVTGALGHVVYPVTTAVYPRFSQLFERGDTRGATEDYHFFSQLVAIVVLPLGALLIFFPAEVLWLWTRDAEVVRHAAVVLSLRALGTVLNALMHVPHVVQLAFGWSTLGARINAVAVLVVAPATVALSLRWGAPGAALAWIGLNLGVLLFAMGCMHRRMLPGELPRWYVHLLLPTLAVAVVGAGARSAMPEALGVLTRLAWLAATGAVAAAAAVAAATAVRRRIVAAARLA